MAVCADNDVAGAHQAQLGQQRVLDAHIAAFVVMGNPHLTGELAGNLDLFGGILVLVGGKMVHDQGHAIAVKDFRGALGAETLDSQRRGDIIGQGHVDATLHDLSGSGYGLVCMLLQNFLS